MRKSKSVGQMVLILLIVAGLLIPGSSFASREKEVETHWAKEHLSRWQALGLLQGDPGGAIRPDDPITRAAFVTLMNRLFLYEATKEYGFSDVAPNAWYAKVFSDAYEAGYVQGNQLKQMQPNKPITREEAAVMVANTFKLKAQSSTSYQNFKDSKSIAAWAQPAVSALYEGGYIRGRNQDQFMPKASITRAEAVVMINKVLGLFIQRPGDYTESALDNMLVQSAGVKLSGLTIGGNLYIAPGVGEGIVEVNKVKVGKEALIQGGGRNSIYWKDSAVKEKLILQRQNGVVLIVISGSSVIPELYISHAAEIIHEGELSLPLVVIGEKAAGTAINIAADSGIDSVLFQAAATVTGEGVIEEAVIEANGVELKRRPTKLTIKPGITVLIGGKKVTAEDLEKEAETGWIPTPGTPSETKGLLQVLDIQDSQVPALLRDYDLILKGEKTLDYKFTLQPSVLPVSDDKVIASVIDRDKMLWIATETELSRMSIYETNADQIEHFTQDKYFFGKIRALLIEGDILWLLTDQKVSKIKY